MALNPPNSGLRAIRHNAVSASKVQLSVPAGDVLHVSDDVADQLIASAREFQEVAAPAPAKAVATVKKSAAKPKA